MQGVITNTITTLIIPSLPYLVAYMWTYDLKRDILTHFGPKKRGLGPIELSEKVGTACKLYQYITKIIIILFLPSLLCFSGIYVDFSPKKEYFDPFWAQKQGLGVIRIIKYWCCKACEYITNIITTLIIPNLPCFSDLFFDLWLENGYFDLFWAQKGGF